MTEPILQIKDLHLCLSGHSILNGVSLSIGRGEYVSIVGPNGAGKTTLVKCISGIHRNWSGSIHIEGKPFEAYKPKALARMQSYVPQAEGRSIPLRVEEFVATGRYPHLSVFTTLTAADRRAIATALAQAGLDQLRHRAMNSLSGGERQMAFIAAALAQEARILLLDEPATFLDYRHQANVAALLKTACRENGITVVAVHHDINTAAAASDCIYALKAGQVAFQGTPGEIANTNILEAIYDTPFTCTPSPDRTIPMIMAGGVR